MDDFIYRALIAAIGVSIIAVSLGCFVIWKRLSYFSDSISHSALLGVALGLATGLGINFGLVIVGGLFATLIVFLQQKDFWSSDAVLGIFSQSDYFLADTRFRVEHKVLKGCGQTCST